MDPGEENCKTNFGGGVALIRGRAHRACKPHFVGYHEAAIEGGLEERG
jgi:hypothetical protein